MNIKKHQFTLGDKYITQLKQNIKFNFKTILYEGECRHTVIIACSSLPY